ncbi:MAG: A/G-specific adenine glycosylase [Planctomycetaceae bacterium]|nr:A/G-specific adenine glycosylase [Planctomycetaceae bacterium]
MGAPRKGVARGAGSPRVDAATASLLRGALLPWFQESARDLPWRRSRDPYAIWISEAMLQQTRVGAVLGYWQRFLDRFPDARRLAEAGDDELMAAWSGLGYYRRARALRDAARVLVEHHGGLLPADPAALAALPGVGPYTAGAISSIAFGLSEPVVDGNVARVFARWFELEAPVGSAELARRAWALAAELVPPAAVGAEGPGAWNQALMELGATLCGPRAPECGPCPVAALCAANRTGRQTELPRPKARAAPVEVELELAVARRRGDLLFVRRPEGRSMGGLFELPTRELAPGAGPTRLFEAQWPLPGLAVDDWPSVGELRHAITHHRIRARLLAAEFSGEVAVQGARELLWCTPSRARELPLSGLAKKALTRLARG